MFEIDELWILRYLGRMIHFETRLMPFRKNWLQSTYERQFSQIILMRSKKMVKILDFFLRNEFWFTSIKSPRFCEWPWILNWRKRILYCRHPNSSFCSPKSWYLLQKFVRQGKLKEWAKMWLKMSIIDIHLTPIH